jgi:hypothetical protein
MQLASAQAGGMTLRAAKCEGAVWTSHATRTISGYTNLNLYNCLYAYKGGYQLDVYGVFQKTSGGLSSLTQGIASNLVGTPRRHARAMGQQDHYRYRTVDFLGNPFTCGASRRTTQNRRRSVALGRSIFGSVTEPFGSLFGR